MPSNQADDRKMGDRKIRGRDHEIHEFHERAAGSSHGRTRMKHGFEDRKSVEYCE